MPRKWDGGKGTPFPRKWDRQHLARRELPGSLSTWKSGAAAAAAAAAEGEGGGEGGEGGGVGGGGGGVGEVGRGKGGVAAAAVGMLKTTWATVPTPIGPFSAVVAEDGAVLASGCGRTRGLLSRPRSVPSAEGEAGGEGGEGGEGGGEVGEVGRGKGGVAAAAVGMLKNTWATVPTPIGPFSAVIAEDGAVLASGWTDRIEHLLVHVSPSLLGSGSSPQKVPDLGPVTQAVLDYHAGDLHAVDVIAVRQKCGASGKFVEHAWDVLRKVPPGRQVSYSEYAALAGRPKAVRAAASACARNAAALFVPCHRVVRSDGAPGEFGWGAQVKRWLLAHEARRGGGMIGHIGHASRHLHVCDAPEIKLLRKSDDVCSSDQYLNPSSPTRVDVGYLEKTISVKRLPKSLHSKVRPNQMTVAISESLVAFSREGVSGEEPHLGDAESLAKGKLH
ncbi:hypothetical protein CBR_g50092 [Chara braunii]|uniref:Methylated-DNA--protein-cysteine methyltransferase n=1 Tax=Chara braunii TaxID=69332 RepID=A0A388M635_CHABU|nr:hypothetical protein CBR_g50092 [Chara braunii]|eukprot:GBG90000.1 hypothetical protein CBR_g50092 [Chara braunii]